jgi:hypothetical protein
MVLIVYIWTFLSENHFSEMSSISSLWWTKYEEIRTVLRSYNEQTSKEESSSKRHRNSSTKIVRNPNLLNRAYRL